MYKKLDKFGIFVETYLPFDPQYANLIYKIYYNESKQALGKG